MLIVKHFCSGSVFLFMLFSLTNFKKKSCWTLRSELLDSEVRTLSARILWVVKDGSVVKALAAKPDGFDFIGDYS